MKNGVIAAILILISGVGFYFLTTRTSSPIAQISQTPSPTTQESEDTPAVAIVAENLDTPWAIAFMPVRQAQGEPDISMLVTERGGTVRHIDSNGTVTIVSTIKNAQEIGEGGLLGIALHPEFATNKYVYLYYTYSGSGDNTLNRVVRMVLRQASLGDARDEQYELTNETIIVDRIPGASNHNGGRIKFGPDGYLYITTGDAQEPSLAQNRNSLAGKILRVTDEGKPAPGAPFGNLVYSYGHRNPQGLAWDRSNNLWSTEHGPSGLQSGNDEVNKIEPGKNYGWPDIQGDQTRSGMENPVVHSGTSDTWAPAGAAVIDNTLFFGGLRGTALYSLDISGGTPQVVAHLDGEYGRIREVIAGPDGMLYVTTSNRDGRGISKENDDHVLRVDPKQFK